MHYPTQGLLLISSQAMETIVVAVTQSHPTNDPKPNYPKLVAQLLKGMLNILIPALPSNASGELIPPLKKEVPEICL